MATLPDDWYTPPAWEAEPSPVPGLSRGEYERIAERILWFESLSLEARIRSFARHRVEQAWFDRLVVHSDAG